MRKTARDEMLKLDAIKFLRTLRSDQNIMPADLKGACQCWRVLISIQAETKSRRR
jgi:hypothetical protein